MTVIVFVIAPLLHHREISGAQFVFPWAHGGGVVRLETVVHAPCCAKASRSVLTLILTAPLTVIVFDHA